MTEAAETFKDEGPFMCLALVKPRSKLASEWQLSKPAYCILEHSPAFGNVEIRWGDGSSQELKDATQLDDLILLRQFDEQAISEIFD